MTGRLFAALLVLTLVFRFWLAAAFPITGDEAYFIWWGWMPDWGFYDHPPMIGWWLAALSLVSKVEWWLRHAGRASRRGPLGPRRRCGRGHPPQRGDPAGGRRECAAPGWQAQ